MCISNIQAQRKIIAKQDSTEHVPFYNGFFVQADLASAIMSARSNRDTYSYEAAIQADIKHKYYPVFEAGFAGADKTSLKNYEFTTSAPFARLGVDFNLMKKKKDSKPTNNLFLAGLRLGMSNFNYKISNLSIEDSYWGGSESVFTSSYNSTKLWWEIVIGVKVEIYKNVFMGWTGRKRILISKDAEGEIFPYYIPGFGVNTTGNWGLNYTIGYRF